MRSEILRLGEEIVAMANSGSFFGVYVNSKGINKGYTCEIQMREPLFDELFGDDYELEPCEELNYSWAYHMEGDIKFFCGKEIESTNAEA